MKAFFAKIFNISKIKAAFQSIKSKGIVKGILKHIVGFVVRHPIGCALVVIGLVGLWLLFGSGGGEGGGKGDSEGAGNSSKPTTQEEVVDKDDKEQGEDAFDGAILKITVMENEYFYENERITVDEFGDIIKDIDGELIVHIKDDNASKNAYDKLLDKLDSMYVDYVEE